MTIYRGSRYTNIPVYNHFDAADFIGNRYTQLYSDANVGDITIDVYDISGMFLGTQLQIVDFNNSETVTVSTTAGPYLAQVWNSLAQEYQQVSYYVVTILGNITKYHSKGTTIMIQKTSKRPDQIPTFSFRVGYLPTDNTDEVIIWRYKDRLDLYAASRYGDPQLYWAILDANPQYTSEMDIQIGDRVVLPSYQKVLNHMRGGN